jgi:D-tyrosyl-tRNA(Tyr) deacylase
VIALLQRVSEAKVVVDEATIGQIGAGLMVLVCAQRGDTPAQAEKLAQKLVNYRVFGDENDQMNLSVKDVQRDDPSAGVLLIPQFTLAANTRSGTRPSFTPAAPPQVANELFDAFTSQCSQKISNVQTGRFGADMKVSLTNDGPVTFWLQVDPPDSANSVSNKTTQ